MLRHLLTGQVLVRVEKSTICGSQIGEIDGVKGHDKFLPHLLGYEGCGRVIDVGEGVSTVKIGDLVVLHWRKGSGINAVPAKYKSGDELINSGWVTTFSEYTIVSENRCTSINTNTKLASLMGCAVTTGFGIIENDANLKIGKNIIVYGSGGVGLNIIQAAKLRSTKKIIAIDLFDKRLNLY